MVYMVVALGQVSASNQHPGLRWWGRTVKFTKGSVADLKFVLRCGLRDTLPCFSGVCK